MSCPEFINAQQSAHDKELKFAYQLMTLVAVLNYLLGYLIGKYL